MFDQGGSALVFSDIVLVVPPDEILLRSAGAPLRVHRADHYEIYGLDCTGTARPRRRRKWILGES